MRAASWEPRGGGTLNAQPATVLTLPLPQPATRNLEPGSPPNPSPDHRAPRTEHLMSSPPDRASGAGRGASKSGRPGRKLATPYGRAARPECRDLPLAGRARAAPRGIARRSLPLAQGGRPQRSRTLEGGRRTGGLGICDRGSRLRDGSLVVRSAWRFWACSLRLVACGRFWDVGGLGGDAEGGGDGADVEVLLGEGDLDAGVAEAGVYAAM